MKLKDKYVVEVTYDYSKFKDLLGNREDQEKRKKIIVNSIKEVGLIPAPIIVNEKFEVVDGQARLAAFKELGLPVYYMRLNGLSLKECIAMNKNQKPWSLKDHIHSYAEDGNENYRILEQFNKKYNISLDVITWALSGKTSSKNNVRHGLFQIDYESLNDADYILNEIKEILNGLELHGKTTYLQLAFGYCLRKPEIDNARLKDRVKKRHFAFPACAITSDWIKEIDKAYNYKTKGEFQVSIYALWQIDQRQKKTEE